MEINITRSHTFWAAPGELLVGCTRFGLILVESIVSASTRVHTPTMAHDPQQSTEHAYFDLVVVDKRSGHMLVDNQWHICFMCS